MRVRASLLVAVAWLLTSVAAGSATAARVMWPHRIWVDGPAAAPVAFHAYTTGGQLLLSRPGGATVPLAARDTLRAMSPGEFPADVSRGALVFSTAGGAVLRVTVGRNGSLAPPISARGRELIVRQGRHGPEIVAR